jgi:hypothetical protein
MAKVKQRVPKSAMVVVAAMAMTIVGSALASRIAATTGSTPWTMQLATHVENPDGQGNPSRPTTAPTSNRFSALEAKGGGKGTGNGKQADEPWQTRAPTRRPLDDRGGPPKPIPVGKVDPWNKKPLPAKTGSGARVSAHEDHPLDAAPAPIGARRSAHEETRVGPSKGKGKHKANQPHEDEVPFDEEETIETD